MKIRLAPSFLEQYYYKGDLFPNLLARSTYLTKYKRPEDTCWTDTVKRVVEGNINLDPNAKEQEAEKLFNILWKMQGQAPGRGWWTGGVQGIPVDARYNCHYVTLRSIDDWAYVAFMSMNGGGVGVGLYHIDELPKVEVADARLIIKCNPNHPDAGEFSVNYIPKGKPMEFITVQDSREGWVTALRQILGHAFAGRSAVVDVSKIRRRGAIIKTFAGVACGPGPLVNMLRAVWRVIRGSAGRKLNSVECLDITNHVGKCVSSGNLRRSALIALSNHNDYDFRNAKKDDEARNNHRWTSNNSIVFNTREDIVNFDWPSLVKDNARFGEPGILNLWKIRQTDPDVGGINPCGEIPLHDREACCLSEVYPQRIDGDYSEVFKLITRYTLRQRLQPMSDPKADAVRKKTMRIGVGLGGICDFQWTEGQLNSWYRLVREEATNYAKDLGVNEPIAVTCVKPSGTISLLCGSSPGIHAPYAPFYVRRTRIGLQEPLAQALIEAGVPYEPSVLDSTGNTLVFSFPTAAVASNYSCNESIRSQFERQFKVQTNWADNAVSATLNFDQSDKEELAGLLEEFVPVLKSTSCLPRAHGYAQAPYEQIDEEMFNSMSAKINFDHPLTSQGDLEVDECSTGACPIR